MAQALQTKPQMDNILEYTNIQEGQQAAPTLFPGSFWL
jgi:hypothetical protein